MISKNHQLSTRLRRLLRIAQGVCLFTLIAFALIVIVTYSMIFVAGASFDELAASEVLNKGETASFTIPQRLVFCTLLNLSNVTGYVALWQSYALFRGYLNKKIFTLKSAARLRIIGWMVLLLPIVNGIVGTITVFVVNSWLSVKAVPFDVSLEDSDLFAVAFGLLIVIVGHVMYQAIGIAEENDSFV